MAMSQKKKTKSTDLDPDKLHEARMESGGMEHKNLNNGEPLNCDDCELDICLTECEFEVGLDSMTGSIKAVELEGRIVRSIKTIIDENENADYSEARCKMLLSEVFKILSGKDYENVCKRITKRNKFIFELTGIKD